MLPRFPSLVLPRDFRREKNPRPRQKYGICHAAEPGGEDGKKHAGYLVGSLIPLTEPQNLTASHSTQFYHGRQRIHGAVRLLLKLCEVVERERCSSSTHRVIASRWVESYGFTNANTMVFEMLRTLLRLVTKPIVYVYSVWVCVIG